jgi:hypothetical protein
VLFLLEFSLLVMFLSSTSSLALLSLEPLSRWPVLPARRLLLLLLSLLDLFEFSHVSFAGPCFVIGGGDDQGDFIEKSSHSKSSLVTRSFIIPLSLLFCLLLPGHV